MARQLALSLSHYMCHLQDAESIDHFTLIVLLVDKLVRGVLVDKLVGGGFEGLMFMFTDMTHE